MKGTFITHEGNIMSEVQKLEREIEVLKQQMKSKKLLETERLVRELRNPNPEIKIREEYRGEDIRRIMKVIFGERQYYNQVSQKARRNISQGGSLLSLQEPEDIIQHLSSVKSESIVQGY